MRIDEACINHNAVKVIRELTDTNYDMISGGTDTYTLTEERAYALMTLGEIRGVINLANALKEELVYHFQLEDNNDG